MTSIIFIGIGQCGSQILESLIDQQINFNRKYYPHLLTKKKFSCIFVDTEQKVLNKIKSRSKYKALLREENIIYGLNGRGSNWCYGYNGCRSAPDMFSNVLESIRKEIERCDNFLGLVLCHSLGGGTGSGFGSKMAELIREEFQLHQIVNCVVSPSDVGGDSPLQYYNSILSLASLNRSSDGIILFHNDSLLNQLGLSLQSPIKTAQSDYKVNMSSHRQVAHQSGAQTSESFSMSSINHLIAQQIGSLFAPCSSLYPWENINSNLSIEINELLRSLCAFPNSKIVRCVTSKNTSRSSEWGNVVKSTARQLKVGYGNVFDTISAICCYRGDVKDKSYVSSISTIQSLLESKMHFVEWNKSDSIDFWIGNEANQNNQVTLAFNSGCITNYLSYIKEESKLKYSTSAYLHWYYRYGGTKETFTESFEEIDKIISSYNHLTS